MSEWVAIQRNPTSGAGPRAVVLRELVRELQRHGLRPRLFARRERLSQWLEEPQRRDNLRCIIAAGGDGTVGDVINRFPGVPMTVCPLGTENLFARYLEIPRCGRRVAEIVAAGNTRRLDLCELKSMSGPTPPDSPLARTPPDPPLVRGGTGRFGPVRFLIMASAGFDAAVVHLTHARRTGHIRRWSYVRSILASLRTYDYPPLRVFLDEAASSAGDANGEGLPARLLVVANLPSYAMRLPVAASARADDGLLDARLFERPSRWNMIRYFWKVWRNRHERLPDVRSVQAASLRIESDVPVPLQIDGDPAGFTPATIRVLPGALTVFAPKV